MRQYLTSGVFALVSAAFILAVPATAFAASVDEEVALCAAALDAEGVAPADQYRAKFVKSKGAAVKTVTVKLVPIADGVEALEAKCRIKRGQVIDASVEA